MPDLATVPAALRERVAAALAGCPAFLQALACSRGRGCQTIRQEGWRVEDTTCAGAPTLYVCWSGLAAEAPTRIAGYARALTVVGLNSLAVVLLPDGRRVRYRPADLEHAGLVPRLLITSN